MVDDFLPVWAQPHRFWLLDDPRREVFTFGLVLTELRSLAHPKGVRSVGTRFGYEWLAGLSEDVQRETGESLALSDLQVFLHEERGIVGPSRLDVGVEVDYAAPKELPDAVLESFAETHGRLIRTWASAKRFNLVDASLGNWALARERVPRGHEVAARRRLEQTEMRHELVLVHGADRSQRWARRYRSLYERAALELEDLAVRRPRPRICPLCNRVFIPLRPGQAICGNQLWDALSGKLVRPCTPPDKIAVYGAAAAADYRKRRKTKWAAMARTLKKHGHGDPRTDAAFTEWEAWKKENPPPRPRGRPPKTTPASEPPYRPGPDAG
jgi:hypothetical protein